MNSLLFILSMPDASIGRYLQINKQVFLNADWEKTDKNKETNPLWFYLDTFIYRKQTTLFVRSTIRYWRSIKEVKHSGFPSC